MKKQPVTTKPLPELDALRLEKLMIEQRLHETQLAFVRLQLAEYLRQLEDAHDARGWDLNLNRRQWKKPEGGSH